MPAGHDGDVQSDNNELQVAPGHYIIVQRINYTKSLNLASCG